jgi:hypothetical protein
MGGRSYGSRSRGQRESESPTAEGRRSCACRCRAAGAQGCPAWMLRAGWQTAITSRGFGWRIHCGVEVTESSTNKQHSLSLSALDPRQRPTDRGSGLLSRSGHFGVGVTV